MRKVTKVPESSPVEVLPEDYFIGPLADKLETSTEAARRKRRITLDCFKAIALGDIVTCRAGYPLNTQRRDGALPLSSVLRGQSSATCRGCLDYEG